MKHLVLKLTRISAKMFFNSLPPLEDIEKLPVGMLPKLYHPATIKGSQYITYGQFREASQLYKYAVIARVTAANHYGTLDAGHREVINELVGMIYILDRLADHCEGFVFTSGRLVGEAMDNNIYVPEHMRPVGWSYMQYRHDNADYIARDELRRSLTVSS